MRIILGALAFASFIFWFSAEARLIKVLKNRNSAKKTITIGFQLDGFTQLDARLDSEVGRWLTNVKNQAEAKLKEDLGIEITLEISDINIPRDEVLKQIRAWSTDGQMHADTVVDYMKTYYTQSYNPDILCLVTRDTLYGDNGLNAEPSYSKHNDLCKDVVPIIIQYKSAETKKSGYLLYTLIKRSFPSNWNSLKKNQRKKLLNTCNIQYKNSDAEYDYYYELPIYKDYVYE
uniref:Putative secreted protein n=1 Tax=Ixodes ricinus TaxID=34613 RepID=V5H0L1_IXORI